MLVYLFRLDGLRTLCAALLDIGLKRRYLLVKVRNVLLDYVCQFLHRERCKSGEAAGIDSWAYANFHWSVVEQGLAFCDWVR